MGAGLTTDHVEEVGVGLVGEDLDDGGAVNWRRDGEGCLESDGVIFVEDEAFHGGRESHCESVIIVRRGV